MTHPAALADDLWREVSHAVRGLLRNKGFAAIAVATVAIGVGASAAIFTLVDTVVFRPLPYQDPARLVKVFDTQPGVPADDVCGPTSSTSRRNRMCSSASRATMAWASAFASVMARSRRSAARWSPPAWLDTLGVKPLLGRGFLADDFAAGRGQVALLAHTFWARRFGSDPATVGRTIVVDDEPFTIIGVLPPNVLRFGADVVRPLIAAEYPQARSQRDLDVVARLKPGVTIARAQAALDTVARRLAHDYPTTNARHGFRVESLGKYYASLERGAERGLLLMLGAVGLVLLVACTNVTNLILARTVARSRECLVRTALGASRARLVRQLLVETAVLFLAGGALGVVVARWSLDALLAFAVTGGYVPERFAVVVDARILFISLAVCLAAALLSGLAPALQASRIDLSGALKSSGSTTSSGLKRRRARRLLIVAELAMTLVLLIGAGLLVRSLLQLRARASGIDATNLLLTASDGGLEFPVAVAYWRRALERTQALPGVRAAAITSRPPVHDSRSQRVLVEGQPRASGRGRDGARVATSRSAPTTSARPVFHSCRGARSPIATTPAPRRWSSSVRASRADTSPASARWAAASASSRNR